MGIGERENLPQQKLTATAQSSCSRRQPPGKTLWTTRLESRYRLTQAVGAERLDVIAPIERRGIRHRTTAQAAARLGQRRVLALLKPVPHVRQHPADVLNTVNVQSRAHHRDISAGHDELDYVFGGVNAARDRQIDIQMTV